MFLVLDGTHSHVYRNVMQHSHLCRHFTGLLCVRHTTFSFLLRRVMVVGLCSNQITRLPAVQMVCVNSLCNAETPFNFWSEDLLRRAWQIYSTILARESRGQWSLAGCQSMGSAKSRIQLSGLPAHTLNLR